MACDHSNVVPPSKLIGHEDRCVTHGFYGCRECAMRDAADRNLWEWERDQRRGHCPQPGCGVFLGDLPEAEWPGWYRDRRK